MFTITPFGVPLRGDFGEACWDLGLLLPDSVRGRLRGSSDDPDPGPRFTLDCEEMDNDGDVDGGGEGLEHVEEADRRREGMDGAHTMSSPSSTSTSSSCTAVVSCGSGSGGGGGGGGRRAGDVLRESWSLSRSTTRSPTPLPSEERLMLKSRGVDISPMVSLRGADRLLVPIRVGTVALTCSKSANISYLMPP